MRMLPKLLRRLQKHTHALLLTPAPSARLPAAACRWGLTTNKSGSVAALELDTSLGGVSGKGKAVQLHLLYLRSWRDMGRAALTCARGCKCDAVELDGHWEREATITDLYTLQVGAVGTGVGSWWVGARVKGGACATSGLPLAVGGTCWPALDWHSKWLAAPATIQGKTLAAHTCVPAGLPSLHRPLTRLLPPPSLPAGVAAPAVPAGVESGAEELLWGACLQPERHCCLLCRCKDGAREDRAVGV